MNTSPWKKSTRSANQGQCVEVRTHADRFEVRDSKFTEGSPILGVSADDWRGFLTVITR